MPRTSEAGARWYRAVWRWHFYAGLYCIPLVAWLAATGCLYLWRPQIEPWLERGYDARPAIGRPAAREAIVAAGLRAVPGASLRSYLLPERAEQATRLLVDDRGTIRRLFLDPATGAVRGAVAEERRPFRLLFHLHGELMAGTIGSLLVETAACWAIVMLGTGLYLWWPRGGGGLAGRLYPRLTAGGRLFWRDLHAVAGLWVALPALGLIVTGLPWASGWGRYLVAVREVTGTAAGPVDWTIGGRAPAHGDHAGMAMAPAALRPGELDRVVARVRPLGLAAPVLVSPPTAPGAPWTVTSDAADRPLRTVLQVDGGSGRILSAAPFATRHPIDRAIGYGIAAHEGALFGLANQLLGTAAALFLMLLSLSGAILWWQRRPAGRLGAPPPGRSGPVPAVLIAGVAGLALLLPLFGLTLLATIGIDRGPLRRSPAVRRWLGLRPA